MHKDRTQVRNKIVTCRFNMHEFRNFQKLLKQSTEKTNSIYLRKLALNQPVTFFYRNQSMDKTLKEIISLKEELYAINHKLHEAISQLKNLDKIPEFRIWCIACDELTEKVDRRTNEILLTINQLASSWWRE